LHELEISAALPVVDEEVANANGVIGGQQPGARVEAARVRVPSNTSAARNRA
jgi:hypothetical protein